MKPESFTSYTPPSFDAPYNQTQVLTEGEQAALKENSFNEGYQKGYSDGQKHGHDTSLQEHDRHVKQILETLYDNVQILKDNNEDYKAQLTEHVHYSISLIIKKLFPFYLKREGKSELRNFVKHTVMSLLDNNGMKIFLHPSMLPHVKEYMAQQPEKSDAFHIVADNTLDTHACTIKWKCGGGLYDINCLHDKIDLLLKNGLDFSKFENQAAPLSTDHDVLENNIKENENV